MGEPTIAATKPCVLKLEPETRWWCACGLSKSQPWCDGSHKETEFRPLRVDIEREGSYALCACKQTGSPPFCDGAHSKL